MKTQLRIINIEDNPNDAELNHEMLSARWPECVLERVDNEADFLSAIEQGGVDAILSDYTIPGFSGRQALELAREKCPDIPFLFVSGTIGEDAAIEAMKHGATDYVLKHRLMRLIPAVQRALQEAAEHAECRLAEQSMRESEHKYRELFECLADPAFLVETQRGRIIDVNRCAESVIHRGRGEILGRQESRFLRLTSEREQAALFDPQGAYTTGCPGELIRADGESVPVEVRTTRLTLYNRPLVLRLAHDARDSANRQSMEELRTRMIAIVESSDDAIISKTLSGTIVSWNAGAERIFGYSEQEAIGRSILMLIPEERQGEEMEILARIGRGEHIDHYETVRLRKDGKPIDVLVTISPIYNAEGRVIGVSKTARDISERKKTAELISASKKEILNLKAALDQHAIVAFTDAQGRITYVNDKFCSISKYSREELLGQDHRIINSGYHPKAFIRGLWKTIARGKVWKGEICNRAKDGGFYWVATTIVPFLDEQGKPYQYIAIRADITKRKHAEEEIRKLNATLEDRVAERTAQFEAANKELDSFSHSVSHDLRAPLRHIAGFAELLQQAGSERLEGDCQRYLAIILDGTKQMAGLIEDLLAFARMGRAEMHKADVRMDELIAEVRRDLNHDLVGRNITWEIGSLPQVTGDRAMLKQVWANLLANAVKYTRRRDLPVIQITCRRNERSEWEFSVRDNGAGFDMQYADKLFGVFQRLHRAEDFEGTGVGLANVQRVILRHRGRVWAQGEVGVGATFYFTLPAHDA